MSGTHLETVQTLKSIIKKDLLVGTYSHMSSVHFHLDSSKFMTFGWLSTKYDSSVFGTNYIKKSTLGDTLAQLVRQF